MKPLAHLAPDQIPIFFVHQGEAPAYLRTAILSARAFNLSSPVFLLGDEGGSVASELGAEAMELRGLRTPLLDAFERRYVHRSTNPEGFERFCFARWFYLWRAMELLGVERGIHMDSDCLLCAGATELFQRFGCHGYTMTRGGGPHCALIGKSLEHLLQVMIATYEPRPALDPIVPNACTAAHLHACLQNVVCDMNVLQLYKEFLGGQHYVTESGPWVVESNISLAEGFECWGGKRQFKRVVWKVESRQVVPYLRRLGTREWVRAGALHYKGSAKRWMPRVNQPAQRSALSLRWAAWHHTHLQPRGLL